MADEAPVKVVIDCSIPDREAAIAYTQDQVDAVLKKRVSGDLTSEETAARLVELADQAAAAATIPDRVAIVPLEGDELAEYNARQDQPADDPPAAAPEAAA